MGCRWKSPITAPDRYHARREAGQVEETAPITTRTQWSGLEELLGSRIRWTSPPPPAQPVLRDSWPRPGRRVMSSRGVRADRRKRRPVNRGRCFRIRTRDRLLAACRGRVRDPEVEALNSGKWAVRPIAGRTWWSYPRRVENRRSCVPGPEENGAFELRRHQPTRPSSTLRGDGSMAAKHDEKGRILIEVYLQRCQARPTADSPREE
jgi:hypothetical protein